MILSPRLDEAFALTRALHAKQVRKNIPVPYLAHLLAVASLVLENTDDEDLVITALLHDTVEDQGGLATLEIIRAQFGDAIAENILALSDSCETPRPPKAERNALYRARIAQASEGVVIVSCCDKTHNLRSMAADYLILGNAIWQTTSLPPQETLANYHALLNIYRQRLGNHRVCALMAQALTAVFERLPKES